MKKDKLRRYNEVKQELEAYKPIINELKREMKDLEYELGKPHTCEKCNQEFSSYHHYAKHYKSKHKNTVEKTECTICRLKFNTLAERSNHECKCQRWIIAYSLQGSRVKQCNKVFLQAYDKRKHKCTGFRTREQAERAMELRGKNIEVPPPYSSSESEYSSTSPEPTAVKPNICITIEPVKKVVEKAAYLTKEYCLKLEDDGVLYNGSRMWNNLIKPQMEDYELEEDEHFVYHKGIVYMDVHLKDLDDFNEYAGDYTAILKLDGDVFRAYDDTDSE